MEPETSPTHKFDENTDEIMDVTTMVNQIDSLEWIMQLMFDQIDMQTHALGKMTTKLTQTLNLLKQELTRQRPQPRLHQLGQWGGKSKTLNRQSSMEMQ